MSAVPAPAATIQVTIDQVAYAPVEIQAKVGDTIEWINKDIVAHTATVRGDWDVMVLPNKSARLVVEKGRDLRLFLPLPSQHEGPHGPSRRSRRRRHAPIHAGYDPPDIRIFCAPSRPQCHQDRHDGGPRNRPINPKLSRPPKMLSRTQKKGRRVELPISTGARK